MLSEQMKRLWLEQLLREFGDICFQYRLKLLPPVFELSGAVKQLGCWVPGKRMIRISHRLIQQYSWDQVLMVLKHEMAHQVCSEVYRLKTLTHGQSFQQACNLLGVTSPYNEPQGDLESVVAAPPRDFQTASGRRLIGRIRKLLALASSDNEHEAALAMQRATEMLTRYNLDLSEQDAGSGYLRLIINTRRKQMPAYRRMICAILRDFFFVQVICSSIYDAESCCSYTSVNLLGRAENVPVAEHCYYFLEHQLPALWHVYGQQYLKGNRRTAKNSYYLGLLQGFSEKMAMQAQSKFSPAEKDSETGSPGALVCSNDAKLRSFVNVHFPRLHKRKARGAQVYSRPFEDAVTMGKKIILHRSVTEKRGDGRKLLL